MQAPSFHSIVTDVSESGTEEQHQHQDDIRQTQISPDPKQIGSLLPNIDLECLNEAYNHSMVDSPATKNRESSLKSLGASWVSIRSNSSSSTKYRKVSSITPSQRHTGKLEKHKVRKLTKVPARNTPSGNLITTSSSGTLVKYVSSSESTQPIAKARKNTVEFNFGVPYGVPRAKGQPIRYAPPYSVPPSAFHPASHTVSTGAKEEFYRLSEQSGSEKNISNWRQSFDRHLGDRGLSPKSRGQGRARQESIVVDPTLSYFERLQKSKFSTNQRGGRGRGRGRRQLPRSTGWDIAKPLGPHTFDHLPGDQELLPMMKDYVFKFAMKTTEMPRTPTEPGQPDNCVQIYLAKHGIQDFFQMMITNIITRRPVDPLDYLIDFTGILARAIQNSNSVGGTKKQPPCFWNDSLKELDSLMFRTAANASAAGYLCCECTEGTTKSR